MPASQTKNQVSLVFGTQWGDEGKGKVVDLLGSDVDVVARYQGGANAGHTVKFDGKTYILHLLPTGILRPGVMCIIGNGVVIHPQSLLDEIAMIESQGLEVKSRLLISENAHIILPYHQRMEKFHEDGSGTGKIGTTRRGIGPAYADKTSRIGVRMGDLLNDDHLKEIVTCNVKYKNLILENVHNAPGVDVQETLDALFALRDAVGDCITDTVHWLNQAIDDGKNVLLEGAQGTLLDIDFGTYPFVTSSNTTVGGVFTGLGIGPRKIDQIIGVMKAYTTRVGDGPFPTELTDEMGAKLRELGAEFGATTGRPRRCGWFDAVIARYAIMINDIDVIALTKLDVLDGLEEICICTGYKYGDQVLNHFPVNLHTLENLEPIYETLPGWNTSITPAKTFDDLPLNAQRYIRRLEELIGVSFNIVSLGPKRDETLWM